MPFEAISRPYSRWRVRILLVKKTTEALSTRSVQFLHSNTKADVEEKKVHRSGDHSKIRDQFLRRLARLLYLCPKIVPQGTFQKDVLATIQAPAPGHVRWPRRHHQQRLAPRVSARSVALPQCPVWTKRLRALIRSGMRRPVSARLRSVDNEMMKR